MFGKTNRETCLNFGMSEGKVKKKKNLTHYASSLQRRLLRFPWNHEVKKPWTENYPHYLSGLLRPLFTLFFSDQSQNNYKLIMKSYMKLHMSLKDSFLATLALKH